MGVLKVFEEEGIPIDLVTGSSIGSFFGALYASGVNLNLLIDFCSELHRTPFMNFRFSRMGLIKSNRIHALVKLLTKGKTFEELKKPLYIVAVDIINGEKVIFDGGSVADAVCASISVPGIFYPYAIGNGLYVDGAVLDIIPASAAREKGADTVIAVNVSMSREAERLDEEVDNMFEVIWRSLDLMGREMAGHLVLDADLVIEPNLEQIGTTAFDKAEQCIELGEEAAVKSLPEIENLLIHKGIR